MSDDEEKKNMDANTGTFDNIELKKEVEDELFTIYGNKPNYYKKNGDIYTNMSGEEIKINDEDYTNNLCDKMSDETEKKNCQTYVKKIMECFNSENSAEECQKLIKNINLHNFTESIFQNSSPNLMLKVIDFLKIPKENSYNQSTKTTILKLSSYDTWKKNVVGKNKENKIIQMFSQDAKLADFLKKMINFINSEPELLNENLGTTYKEKREYDIPQILTNKLKLAVQTGAGYNNDYEIMGNYINNMNRFKVNTDNPIYMKPGNFNIMNTQKGYTNIKNNIKAFERILENKGFAFDKRESAKIKYVIDYMEKIENQIINILKEKMDELANNKYNALLKKYNVIQIDCVEILKLINNAVVSI
jgi:uncharacterized protein YktA (UPF0223 family)